MNKGGESIMKSLSNMPANISGVALKETDYIAFECQAFDASGVGFYEIFFYLHFLAHHLRLIQLSQYV